MNSVLKRSVRFALGMMLSWPSLRVGPVLGLLVSLSCLGFNTEAYASEATGAIEPSSSEATQVRDQESVRLLAVGDILFHQPLHRALKAERSKVGDKTAQASEAANASWAGPPGVEVSWPFSLLRRMAHRADLVVGNLETPINKRRLAPPKPMRFSSPVLIAERMAEAGIDALNIANNHAYDQGQRGLDETLEHLKAHRILAFGLSDRGTPHAPTFIERNGISFAFIGYSFLTNRLPDALNEEEAQINLIAKRQRHGRRARLQALDKVIGEAKEKADYVIVSAHWGDEYVTTPTKEQRRLGERMIQAGADLILGHHPHVLQPIVRKSRTHGSDAIVAYSLGNYIANQSYYLNLLSSKVIPKKPTTRDSVILEFEFSPVSAEAPTGGMQVRAHPVWLVNRPAYQDGRKSGRWVEPRLINELQVLEEYRDRKRLQQRLKERKHIILQTLGVEEAI